MKVLILFILASANAYATAPTLYHAVICESGKDAQTASDKLTSRLRMGNYETRVVTNPRTGVSEAATFRVNSISAPTMQVDPTAAEDSTYSVCVTAYK